MTEQQKERYNSHIILPEIGKEGQEKLLLAKVLIVGAGGLGAPVIEYLAAAGVGNIGIIDNDVISLSNLQRQIIYNEKQIGQLKVNKAKELIKKLNSDINISVYNKKLSDNNAEEIIKNYEIVIGATDNFKSRLLIDKYTAKYNIPFVHGAIREFKGEVAVFNYKGCPAYSDLFPETSDLENSPSGVLGVLPGVIGSLQAIEVIKIILNKGDILSGRLLLYDALKTKFEIISFD